MRRAVQRPVVLGITLGDPAGIGPEIAVKAVYGVRWPAHVRLVLIGSAALIRDERRRQKRTERADSAVSVFDPTPGRCHAIVPGRCSVRGAQLAVRWIEAGVQGCLAGALDGLVTGPINKEGLLRAGVAFPGHTELLAARTGTRRFGMLLVGGPLRVILATRHVALAQVSKRLSAAAIVEAAGLMAEALPWLGVRQGTIGVCALNPHGGDGGALGDEERRVIAPALRTLRRQGVRVEGPVPADVIFHQAVEGRYAAVLAMYHDQGLAPLKMLAFESGVNITLGLPILRTSPDHGTAYDIAGRGIANPASLVAAIRLAAGLAGRRNPWARDSGSRA